MGALLGSRSACLSVSPHVLIGGSQPLLRGQGSPCWVLGWRVKQVEFPDDVRNSVYQQMREERGRIAAERRAQGMEVSEEKRSTADKERTIILANANKDSQIIRGEGDAKAAEIYANAYNQDPEFYAFYRSIDAYRNSIGNANDIMVIDPDNEFFQYLNKSNID